MRVLKWPMVSRWFTLLQPTAGPWATCRYDVPRRSVAALTHAPAVLDRRWSKRSRWNRKVTMCNCGACPLVVKFEYQWRRSTARGIENRRPGSIWSADQGGGRCQEVQQVSVCVLTLTLTIVFVVNRDMQIGSETINAIACGRRGVFSCLFL
jgi:hypothetical protein